MTSHGAARSDLISSLRSLSPGRILTIAPKHFVVRGHEYFRRGCLVDLQWSGSSHIVASVRGRRLYSVDISFQDDGVGSRCDCPAWTLFDNCKHVVCALMTIKNIMDGSFGSPPPDEGRTKALIDALLGERDQPLQTAAEPATGYAIVIGKKNNGIEIFVEWNGKRAVPYARPFPIDLVDLGLPLDIRTKGEALSSILKKHGGRYPIVLRTGEDEKRIRFDRAADWEAVTELDARGDSVVIGKAFHRPGESAAGGLVLGDVAIDPLKGVCGIVHDKSGWLFWEDTLSLISNSPGDEDGEASAADLVIPRPAFRSLQYFFPATMGTNPAHLLLKLDGQAAQPAPATPAYRLTITRQDNESFTLRPDCVIADSAIAPSGRLFHIFSLLPMHSCLPLRAKMRRSLICRVFFDMLKAGSRREAEQVINRALSDDMFRQHEAKRQARLLLLRCLTAFSEAEVRLFLSPGGWILAPVEKDREASLYRISYEVFGEAIFDNMADDGAMSLPAGTLARMLPLLHRKLAEESIELFFEGKPVKQTTWDFAFDAARAGGIDWFEIRPEIRCKGELVDENTWRAVLAGQGMMETTDCMQIVDPDSQKILSMIAEIFAGSGALPGRKEIVQVPRLRILDWLHLRKSGVRVTLPPEDEAVLERLTNFRRIAPRTLPSGLKAGLRNYQKDGYAWLSFLYENRLGACLADDMGLGKTLQAICLLGAIREGIVRHPAKREPCPHLVVLPPSLLFNWESEIRRFFPDLRITQYTGTGRTASFDGYDVVLTTYGLVRRDIEILKEIQFDAAVFDEAQAIKNIVAGTTGAVRRLKAHFKLALTGTPLENHIGEYYSIVDLVLPGLLGEYTSFKSLIGHEASAGLDIAVRRTRPFVLRRTKAEILKELPAKIETDIYLELTEKQRALYRKTVDEVKNTIDRAYRTKTRQQAQIIALTAILKLRQLCVAPQLLSRQIKDPPPKIQFLLENLKEVMDEAHSALVFSQFTSFLDILEKDLRKHRIPFRRLDGSTPVGKRKTLVEGFQNSREPSVFLLSLKAGGQGLNLTRASYVFHLDPWWNPAVENQASDRAHRIGQTKTVTITRILMKHTIEEKMMELKKRKLELYKAVMEEGRGRNSLSISRRDFDLLLG